MHMRPSPIAIVNYWQLSASEEKNYWQPLNCDRRPKRDITWQAPSNNFPVTPTKRRRDRQTIILMEHKNHLGTGSRKVPNSVKQG